MKKVFWVFIAPVMVLAIFVSLYISFNCTIAYVGGIFSGHLVMDEAKMSEMSILYFYVYIALAVIYFFLGPSIIAYFRNHPKTQDILILNIKHGLLIFPIPWLYYKTLSKL